MIYKLRNRELKRENGEVIDLTPIQHKFLIALSTNETEKYSDICEYIYKCKLDKGLMNLIKKHKFDFVKKTGLRIKTIANIGYRLVNETQFE